MITKLLSRRLKAAANEVYTAFIAPSEQMEFGMHPFSLLNPSTSTNDLNMANFETCNIFIKNLGCNKFTVSSWNHLQAI